MPERPEPRPPRRGGARRWRALFAALAAPAILALVAGVSLAQTRSRGGGRPRPKPAPRGATPSADAATATASPASPAAAIVPAGADGGAGVVESRTLDGGTHVFKFGELDIEGRLKSPQLVYFLRRVRAEFTAGELGHRTFLPEMAQTRKEPTF